MKEGCQKTNIFIFFILLSWTDASHLPAEYGFFSGGALVQTCCQKSEKTTADISDNARAADLQKNENDDFSGNGTRTGAGMKPPPESRLP